MQKIIACAAQDAPEKVNSLLTEGWVVKDMISESVAVATTKSGTVMSGSGLIVFLLEKTEK